MYRKRRSASVGSEVVQKEPDFKLGTDAAEMLTAEWATMPVPGVRAAKNQPHHRRTSSRIMEELSTTHVFDEKVLGKKVAKRQLEQETPKWLVSREQQVAVPWRFCIFVVAALTCSFVMETAVDRHQKAHACGRLFTEKQQLERRFDMYKFDTKEQMAALAQLLGKEAAANRLLREELDDIKRWRKFMLAGENEHDKEIELPNEGSRSWWSSNFLQRWITKLWQNGQRSLWCFRFRAAQPVRFIRDNLRITADSKLYRELTWLEEFIRGPY